MARMGAWLLGVCLVVSLSVLNVTLAASTGSAPPAPTEEACLKCCGQGGTAQAYIGHRACNNQTDCHVTDCPEQSNCVDYDCQQGDTYNDVCRELDEGWNCDSFNYHRCL